VNERCIVLDVANDQYLQVSAHDFNSLLPFVAPPFSVNSASFDAEIPAHLSAAANELLEANVLSPIPSLGERRPTPSVPRPTEMVSTTGHNRSMTKAGGALPYFLKACTTADYCLRRASLSRICARVTKRKRKSTPKPDDHAARRAIQLTQVFNTLRPFYPRDYRCMFDSLALVEFLGHWRISPHWVFGVRVDPFEAHCWIQHGDVVLSDTTSFSSRWYCPIMVV
jgi:hypothetical protein